MHCVNAIKPHRKSGGAQWRDLQYHPTSINILVIQLPPQVFRRGHPDKLNHPQRIRRDLATTVVTDLALTRPGDNQNLDNIVHAFHLGNKKLARARLIRHNCPPFLKDS
jgi:hypothetical protein